MTNSQYQSLKIIRNQLSDFVRNINRTNPHLSDEAFDLFLLSSGSVFIALRDFDDLCQELGITVQE